MHTNINEELEQSHILPCYSDSKADIDKVVFPSKEQYNAYNQWKIPQFELGLI